MDCADVQQQEKYYGILLEARSEAFRRLKPGAVAKDVYEGVQAFVSKKSGTLGSALAKQIGFQVSLETDVTLCRELTNRPASS